MLKKIVNHLKQGTLIPVLVNKFHPNRLFIRVFRMPHIYNRLEYKRQFGILKSIKKPETFSQKIYYLRDIYDSDELATQVSDKYEVRKYLKKLGLGHLLNDLIGMYNSPSEINFAELPNQFVIKTNHASSTNIIVKNKSDIDEQAIKKQLGKWLRKNYAYSSGEMQYLNIKPKIIIENFLNDFNDLSSELQDYQIWCFDGKPELINTHLYISTSGKKIIQRFSFDLNFNRNDIIEVPEKYQIKIPKPRSLNKMLEYSKLVSKPFKFARIDFYDINNKPILGEITLTPSGGNNHYIKPKYQLLLGKKIEIKERVHG